MRLQSGTKLVETLFPEGPLCLANLKKENAFPSPPPPSNVVLLFELPAQNNKHPNFEWKGGEGL